MLPLVSYVNALIMHPFGKFATLEYLNQNPAEFVWCIFLDLHNLADNIDEMASLGIVLATNSGNYFNSDLTLFWYKAFCKASLICDNSANCCIIVGFKFVILSITLVD